MKCEPCFNVLSQNRYIYTTNTFPNDSLKWKQFAEDNFEFEENGEKFSKRRENAVGNGEIARYEQFLLLPQHFQKTCGHVKTRAYLGKVSNAICLKIFTKFYDLHNIGSICM